MTGLESINASLRAGRPVLVDVAFYGSHTFVVAGFEEHTKQILVRASQEIARRLSARLYGENWHVT